MGEVAAAGHVHLDPVGGVAGDMFAAALLDACPELQPRVWADLAAVAPPGLGTPALTPGTSGGLRVQRFGLAGLPAAPDGHGHGHGHGQGHGHGHGHAHAHHHGSRYVDLVQHIERAALRPGTAAQAGAILRRLAECESRQHSVPLEQVHFHEIGDWDSLLDVVAAGSIAAALTGWHWSVSALPRGDGVVHTSHGLLPVPAPATVDLLTGFAWRDDGIGGERVTPTGAAILAHLVDRAAPPPRGLPLAASGMGAGTRELAGAPNVLRALVFRSAGARAYDADAVVVIDFDVDDMSGEELGVAAERLRAVDGVLDLSLGTRIGKKGRPLHDVRLLLRPEALDAVCRQCFAETSTLGLRWRHEARACLPRQADQVTVAGQVLRRKHALRAEGTRSTKVESDDLATTPSLAARRRLRADGEAAS